MHNNPKFTVNDIEIVSLNFSGHFILANTSSIGLDNVIMLNTAIKLSWKPFANIENGLNNKIMVAANESEFSESYSFA